MDFVSEDSRELYTTLRETLSGMARGQIPELLGSTAAARTAIAELQRHQLIQSEIFSVVLVRPEAPLYCSLRDGVDFTPWQHERAIRHRYSGPTERIEVLSVGRFSRPKQVNHELAVAEIFLKLRNSEFRWLPESRHRSGNHIQDFTLVHDATGEVICGDFVGTYRGNKLQSLHRNIVVQRGQNLQLW